ncbi:sulfotransferase family 2 domain-containing protein [Dickeya chrysanthemi]|uniref:sulfotransferase family 2 domain-containing protein n=1 Tax=Dickeya chrysanthemi TaxID=556 RepID=UPI000532B109|nr:sulfotransferase family 2 domain-containing protein [Dickeya chrysanthemi]
MNEADITFAYNYYLHREPDPQGMAVYKNSSSSSKNLEYDLFNSDEYKKNKNILMYPLVNIGRKICILPEAKIVFVPIAKNAHTSITEAFLSYRGIDWKKLPINDRKVLEFGNEEHRFHAAIEENETGVLIKDLPPRIIHEALSSPDYLRVAVIREPFKRLMSAYNHLVVQSVKNEMMRRHTSSIWKHFERGLTERISFMELIKYISCVPDNEIDAHFAPQHTFVGNFNINKFIPMEKLNLLEELIEQRSGKKFNIKHMNTHSASLKPEDIVADDNTKKFINDRYWMDVKLYQEAVAVASKKEGVLNFV